MIWTVQYYKMNQNNDMSRRYPIRECSLRLSVRTIESIQLLSIQFSLECHVVICFECRFVKPRQIHLYTKIGDIQLQIAVWLSLEDLLIKIAHRF